MKVSGTLNSVLRLCAWLALGLGSLNGLAVAIAWQFGETEAAKVFILPAAIFIAVGFGLWQGWRLRKEAK